MAEERVPQYEFADITKVASILVVDHHKDQRVTIATILKQNGLNVRTAESGSAAVEAIEEHTPDLVIINIQMPDGENTQVSRCLQTHPQADDIPIIFAGPWEDSELKDQAFNSGAADYFSKPIHEQELLTKVKSTLDLYSMRRIIQRGKQQLIEAQNQIDRYRERLEALEENRSVAISKANELKEAANLAKNNFLSAMSHELRTPLNAILGFSRLMENNPNLTRTQSENIGLIHSSGRHLLNLINDVLEMSKIDSGNESLNLTPTDLIPLIRGVAAMFQSRAADKGLTFHLKMMPDMPHHVKCDNRKLRQIMMNLIKNSLNYTNKGGIDINVWVETDASADPRRPKETGLPLILFFEVRDTGPGIPPELLETIFDPFFMEKGHRGGKIGTGLGLTISRSFARLMGGDISVVNRQNQGARFTLTVPVETAAQDQAPDERQDEQTEGIENRYDGYRCVVADDDKINRFLLKELLDGVGFDVIEADNGQRAVSHFFTSKPHIIFMDIRMPVMNGFEATKIIKATKEGFQTPVIAVSAHSEEYTQHSERDSLFDGYLQKPYEEQQLNQITAKHLTPNTISEKAQAPDSLLSQKAPDADIEMTQLPTPLLKELRQTALELDLEKTNACIEQIQSSNPSLGRSLFTLAKGFRFDEIFNLAEGALGPKK